MGKGKQEVKSPRFKNASAITKPQPRLRTACVTAAANIKVVVRVRPPNNREEGDNQRLVVRIVDDQMVVFDPKQDSQAFFYHGVQQKGRDLLRKPNKDMQFVFDKVFGFEATNDEIFESTTKNLIKSLMDGYNCSVFAYGATGAGKTHTMLGHSGNPGITYLTMAELFKAKQELTPERNFELGMTYLEVYNETVQDLLNPGAPLQLREDGKYGVTVAGIKMHKIEDPDKLFTLLEQGNGNRTQHPTDANAESSRSHAVFQVYIQMEFKATREVRAAKLSMIDLAGSERGSATGFVGARFTEGANINKSLLALGNCINSLADGQRHVPYRDSKLTRLLKDSLGGNCQTIMVANVAPSSLSYEDTYNTLKYATRAKKIKSQMRRNVVNKELHAGEYVKIVENLKMELERAKEQLRERTTETEKSVDVVLAGQLRKLFEEKTKVSERIFNLESSESMVVLRRRCKEEADSRLSGVCSDTPEREEVHRRLGNTVDRFNRQEDTFKTELVEMNRLKSELEAKIAELVQQHPELENLAEVETAKLAKIEAQYQVELGNKKVAFLEGELQLKYTLLEKTCKMLKPFYFQLRGCGFATDSMISQYQGLMREMQGLKCITWQDTVDSGVSSTSVTSEAESRPGKRKLNDENLASPLDNTYVLEIPKTKFKVCGEELVTKVSKTPPLKKSAKDNISQQAKNRWAVAPLASKPISQAHKRAMIGLKPATSVVNRRPFRT